MTEEIKLYIYGANEPYVVFGNDEHDDVTNQAITKVAKDLKSLKTTKIFW